MPIPYLHHELFELNSGIRAGRYEIEGIGPIVIVDQMYKYPSDIQLMLDQAWVPSHHINKHSRNFKDYYDCRYTIHPTITEHSSEFEAQKLIRDLARTHLGYDCLDKEYEYIFNCFKWINSPEQSYQMMPHQDSTNHIASVTYFNDNENHGTAFYTDVEPTHEEVENVSLDINEYATLVDVIPAKKNRTIIYPSWYWHGAYMNDHSEWVDNWRYSQVYFNKLKPDFKL
jgi:hypothetical protein